MLFSIIEYIKYLFRSFHLHGIHSPFVFDLDKNIFKQKIPYYSFDEIESIRAKLILTEKEIKILDLGAGSKKLPQHSRKVSEIAKSSLKSDKFAQLLYRMAFEFKPDFIIELGTSFGITTSYLGKACPNSIIYSLEGSPEIAKIAKINFKKLKLENISIIVGDFNDTLSKTLSKFKQVDMVYFDGNHQEKATIEYFNQCLAKAHENSIFIFDDIYWSKGMKKAWEFIKGHSDVTVTIDLFEVGIVFFKKDQTKQNFTIYQ